MSIRRSKFFEILSSENNREACRKYCRYTRSDQSGKSFRDPPLNVHATRHQIWTRSSTERTSYEKCQETECLSRSSSWLLEARFKQTLENIKFRRKWPVFRLKFLVEWLSENIPPLNSLNYCVLIKRLTCWFWNWWLKREEAKKNWQCFTIS